MIDDQNSLHDLENGGATVRRLVRRLVESAAAMPGGAGHTTGVFVELNLSWSVKLGKKNDLTGMHREVLNDVINRAQHIRVPLLNHDRSLEVRFGQSREDALGLTQDCLEIRHGLGCLGAIALRRLARPITAQRWSPRRP